MTSSTSRRLRTEARALREVAKMVWFQSEELLERATALNAEAEMLERRADEEDDLAEVSALTGAEIALRKGSVAA